MREQAQQILELAKKNLIQDGSLAPVCLMFKGGSLVAPIMLRYDNDDSKYEGYYNVGVLCGKQGADAVVTVNEVWTRKPKGKSLRVEDIEKEKPMRYPESERGEAIFVCILYLKEMRTEGISVDFTRENGKPVFGPVSDFMEQQGDISRVVFEGYELACIESDASKHLTNPE